MARHNIPHQKEPLISWIINEKHCVESKYMLSNSNIELCQTNGSATMIVSQRIQLYMMSCINNIVGLALFLLYWLFAQVVLNDEDFHCKPKVGQVVLIICHSYQCCANNIA